MPDRTRNHRKEPIPQLTGFGPVDKNGVYKNPGVEVIAPEASDKLKEDFLTLINRVREYEAITKGIEPDAK